MRALLLCLFLVTSASAQPVTEAPRPSWFSFGVGTSTGRTGSPALGGVSVQIVAPLGSAGPFVVQGGASGAQELGLLRRSGADVFEGHVGVGVAGATGPLRLAVVLGPSVTHVALAEYDDSLGYRRRTGRGERFLPGAYASVQGVVALSSGFGLSAEVFGLANADLPTGGFRLGLVVGNL